MYCEFDHLHMLFRVAIECEDWNRRVDKGAVMEFFSKVEDLNNIAGVMVSRGGYQRGAVHAAQTRGILLLTVDDLPTLPQIVAQNCG